MSKYCWIVAIVLVILLLAGVAALWRGCRCDTPASPSSPLKLRIVYREKHYLEGENVIAVDGIQEFIFQNTSSTRPVVIKMPPSEITMMTSNSTSKLEEKDWPAFARTSGSFTLPPGGQRTFTRAFCMDRVKAPKEKKRSGPNFCFSFASASDGKEGDEDVFVGEISSESSWDDSRTVNVQSRDSTPMR